MVSRSPTSPAFSASPLGFYPRLGKRVFDIVVAISALVVLSPVLILIGLLILLTDPGSIIFSQQRIGRNGLPFRFYKFRSMPVGTKNLPSDQIGNVRITWFGRLLRRSNIDELPQLANILKGDMSLVGPRPPIPTQTELLHLRAENGSLACRPGLTGLAQVSSYDGMPVVEKARYDGIYASKISLLVDLRIILRTFSYMTRRPPVY